MRAFAVISLTVALAGAILGYAVQSWFGAWMGLIVGAGAGTSLANQILLPNRR